MKKPTVALAAILTFGMAGTAAADQFQDAIDYRQAAFTVIKGNFKPMGAMVKGKIPYDSEAFTEYAANLAAMARMADDGFIDGSDMGDTAAKSAVWEERADFDAKMKKFQEQTANLAVLAKSGSLDDIKPQFAAAAKSCKSCHDDFKEE